MKKHLLLASAVILSFGGCVNIQNHPAVEALQGALGQLYVETYIQYAGPQEKWSGPGQLIVHVNAREAGNAQISVTPPSFQAPAEPDKPAEPGTTVQQRTLASAKALTSEQARDQLAHLATEMQGADTPFYGCLYPVRVRLVRADGALLEKQGCRGQGGWTKAASDTTAFFLSH